MRSKLSQKFSSKISKLELYFIFQFNKTLKIGVVFHGNPLAGGGFHDGLSSTLLVANLEKDFDFAFYTPDLENADSAKKAGLQTKLIKFGRLHKLGYQARKKNSLFSFLRFFKGLPSLDEQFEKDGVDLVYFTSPNPLCLFLERLNFVLPVWDLCHRDHPEFPEVRESFEFESRESFLNTALPKATAVIAESPFGKEALIRRYRVDPEKVHFIWKPPSTKILSSAQQEPRSFNPRRHAGIPHDAQFIFYPSQFWAHKNHRLIIDALFYLKKHHQVEIFALFCGSDCGNLESVLNYSKKLGVSHLIKYVGFAPDEHIPAYYQESLALVMPSCFGPTNMPPVEAFALGSPVIAADLPGFKDQIGEAGELVNPYDPKALGTKLLQLLEDHDHRMDLIRKGKQRAAFFSDAERLSTLKLIFRQFEKKQSLWKFD